MTEVDCGKALPCSTKKARKNKLPIYRPIAEKADTSTSIRLMEGAGAKAKKAPSPSSALMADPSVTITPSQGGSIKSYSDFMRSLAAKYNNNE
jgi:hypothetical protein